MIATSAPRASGWGSASATGCSSRRQHRGAGPPQTSGSIERRRCLQAAIAEAAGGVSERERVQVAGPGAGRGAGRHDVAIGQGRASRDLVPADDVNGAARTEFRAGRSGDRAPPTQPREHAENSRPAPQTGAHRPRSDDMEAVALRVGEPAHEAEVSSSKGAPPRPRRARRHRASTAAPSLCASTIGSASKCARRAAQRRPRSGEDEAAARPAPAVDEHGTDVGGPSPRSAHHRTRARPMTLRPWRGWPRSSRRRSGDSPRRGRRTRCPTARPRRPLAACARRPRRTCVRCR